MPVPQWARLALQTSLQQDRRSCVSLLPPALPLEPQWTLRCPPLSGREGPIQVGWGKGQGSKPWHGPPSASAGTRGLVVPGSEMPRHPRLGTCV